MEPPVPYGTSLKPYKNTVGSVMKFKCFPGYATIGKAEVYCMGNGKWSMPKFQCVKSKEIQFNLQLNLCKMTTIKIP